ncbi:MAG: hypothetical protein DMG74_17580 [Acidobacteria bacterium]|nr:MAG: hypothetical protein DMG74_17580 [Acidobacteriota bacterium]
MTVARPACVESYRRARADKRNRAGPFGVVVRLFLPFCGQHRPMLFYRVVFLLFGLVLGWLLWQKNKRERDFRRLAEALKR